MIHAKKVYEETKRLQGINEMGRHGRGASRMENPSVGYGQTKNRQITSTNKWTSVSYWSFAR